MASRSLSFFKFQRFSVEINGHFYSKLNHGEDCFDCCNHKGSC
ncbi:unnamed protein product [Brassica napus]|uniref:(rape) hypothetical protein n=1 Tax=Brassica napus TaxID=3708 RepID=A0A816X5D4_BRANA|nr:unnamed protein product [Brassica napus]